MNPTTKIIKITIFKLIQAQTCHLSLFEEEEKEEKLDTKRKKCPSYLDDIGLVASSKSIEENCQLLQKLAQDLLIK